GSSDRGRLRYHVVCRTRPALITRQIRVSVRTTVPSGHIAPRGRRASGFTASILAFRPLTKPNGSRTSALAQSIPRRNCGILPTRGSAIPRGIGAFLLIRRDTMTKYVVKYTLSYLHRVEVGIEADDPDKAVEQAEQLFDDGDIWDDTPACPLLFDDFEEDPGAGIPLMFEI